MGDVRVVIADDDVLLREGLASLLERSGFEIVGQAGDSDSLLSVVRAHKPDLVVTYGSQDALHAIDFSLDRICDRIDEVSMQLNLAVTSLEELTVAVGGKREIRNSRQRDDGRHTR